MTRTIAISIVSLAIAAAPASAEIADNGDRASRDRTHKVTRGQTLSRIAKTHGCSVAAVKRANGLRSDFIRAGQSLIIPACSAKAGKRKPPRLASLTTHTVTKGDTLGKIAKRYDTTVRDIQSRNSLRSTLIRPGQELRIAVGEGGSGRPIKGQSVGSPHRGKLVGGVQLPRGKGYFRRRPNRAWGANHTIFYTRHAIDRVRSRVPKIHTVAIGDISHKRGGRISRHVSHQSGRDVDIGMYFKKRPRGYPKSFISATPRTMHMLANWTLLDVLARTADQPGGVYMMFLDYDLQGALYEWAKKRGVSKKWLGRMFQYPRGKYAARGIVRHEPGHADHVHVRFRCPPDDRGCR